jgi:hypothetical protein
MTKRRNDEGVRNQQQGGQESGNPYSNTYSSPYAGDQSGDPSIEGRNPSDQHRSYYGSRGFGATGHGGLGYSGLGAFDAGDLRDPSHSGGAQPQEDPHYQQWREEQMRRLDEEYRQWHQERYQNRSREGDKGSGNK